MISETFYLVVCRYGLASGSALFLSSHYRGLVGKFTTSQAWRVTSVEAWMQVDEGGPVRAIIYKDDAGGTIPETKLFSQELIAVVMLRPVGQAPQD